MTYQTSIQLKSAIKKYFPNITSGGLNILDIGIGDGVVVNGFVLNLNQKNITHRFIKK